MMVKISIDEWNIEPVGIEAEANRVLMRDTGGKEQAMQQEYP